ncbi:MAG: methylmalonyl Co-A mutase-associated GTPase MeaB [Burkholderiaceae bacterium]|nr:methylmalonyl Co-A mutase-associated GTPase MeaB [Sulfuritalea sp.]MCF8176130.1 methylmalonyl Co-A mutase-associated GTPase MeaB [Burkholderiaceae bacterium]
MPELGQTELDAEGSALAQALLAGERRALAKAITLAESTREDHRLRAQQLLAALLPHTGRSLRIGISGVPGVGKSTFIEALGMYLIEHGHRLAVLAVDPSSSVHGGSILGDKTRMELLSQRSEAFIRPSPASGSLGGVAERTREALLLCEAAGYDIIIVETVGVGQSETAVAGMTDTFVLLQLPNAGDDLQAIKKGIVELADVVVFNKADIDPKAAQLAAAQMRSALSMLHPASSNWQPPVLTLSSIRKEGLVEFWQVIEKFRSVLAASGEFETKRRHQALAWMWQQIDSGLRSRFRQHPAVKAALVELSVSVEAGTTTPAAAAQRLLALVGHTSQFV